MQGNDMLFTNMCVNNSLMGTMIFLGSSINFEGLQAIVIYHNSLVHGQLFFAIKSGFWLIELKQYTINRLAMPEVTS